MVMNSRQRATLAALCPSVRWEVSMASHSTFRAGGVVEAMVEPVDSTQLAALLRWLHGEGVAWRAIGGGSNILVTSRYHEGVFIRLRGSVHDLRTEPASPGDPEGTRVAVEAGCSLAAFVSWCAGQGLRGLECLAGIPGSVGGAIRMNAGAFDHAIGESLHSLFCISEHGEVREMRQQEINCAYRTTRLPGEPGQRWLICRSTFLLQRADQQTLTARCREIIARRREKQPAGVGSAGSFFKNPEGDYAGRLIEQAGLKGLTRGGAMVSPTHANFIVNTGGAEPEDIIALMQEVRERVLTSCGVLLEPEVHIL